MLIYVNAHMYEYMLRNQVCSMYNYKVYMLFIHYSTILYLHENLELAIYMHTEPIKC